MRRGFALYDTFQGALVLVKSPPRVPSDPIQKRGRRGPLRCARVYSLHTQPTLLVLLNAKAQTSIFASLASLRDKGKNHDGCCHGLLPSSLCNYNPSGIYLPTDASGSGLDISNLAQSVPVLFFFPLPSSFLYSNYLLIQKTTPQPKIPNTPQQPTFV